jgi:hypothetical protein
VESVAVLTKSLGVRNSRTKAAQAALDALPP